MEEPGLNGRVSRCLFPCSVFLVPCSHPCILDKVDQLSNRGRAVAETTKTYDPATIERWSAEMEGKEPQEILRWAVDEFQPGLTMACQLRRPLRHGPPRHGHEDRPHGRSLLPRHRLPLPRDLRTCATSARRSTASRPSATSRCSRLTQQADKHGAALWSRDPDACCEIRKVEPNYRALEGNTAWIAGMRRDQAKTRGDIGIVEWDSKFNLVKLNPLAAWDESRSGPTS